jgi:hypothetical protein
MTNNNNNNTIQTNTEDDAEIPGIRFVDYKDESQLEYVMSLVVSFSRIFNLFDSL